MNDQLKLSISYEIGVNSELLKKIEELIENSKFGVTVADVCRALKLTRITAKKYLEALISMGKIKKEKRGNMIFYYKPQLIAQQV